MSNEIAHVWRKIRRRFRGLLPCVGIGLEAAGGRGRATGAGRLKPCNSRHVALGDPRDFLEVKHEGSRRARNAQHWPHAVEWYAAWRAAHFPVSG